MPDARRPAPDDAAGAICGLNSRIFDWNNMTKVREHGVFHAVQ
jgi:hypothetical protein